MTHDSRTDHYGGLSYPTPARLREAAKALAPSPTDLHAVGAAMHVMECAAERMEQIEAALAEAKGLLREWKSTDLDPMDEEYQPWIESFTRRIDALQSARPAEGSKPT